jgi:purine-binding chemotaxis protein CheW
MVTRKRTVQKKKHRSSRKKTVQKQRGSRQEPGTSPDDEKHLAVFSVGTEWYGFNLDLILEIIYSFDIISVPHLPQLFAGAITVREESIPAVDLHSLLNKTTTESTDRTCVLTMVGAAKIGFIVDSDAEITDITQGTLYPLPDCYTKEEASFIEGIFWFKDKFVGILNPAKTLDVLGAWRPGSEKI